MDADADRDATIPVDDVTSVDPEAGSSKIDLLEGLSSNGGVTVELGHPSEVLTRVELDLAYYSEKLINLNILTMHVATRENDFEAFASEEENKSLVSIEKALEFDLLSGILDSEVRELDSFMATLQAEIVNAREIISSCEHLGETFLEMEEKFHDSEKSLKQSQDQVLEMRMQSDNFQRTLSCFGREENWNGDKDADFLENGQFSNTNSKIKMQTAEQQRHILRMLEKSLARELDLEKKLTESRQIEEELKLRLHSSEQEMLCMEEETRDVFERLFGADNTAGVLMEISKELLGQLQLFQFKLNGSIQREDELRSKLEDSTKQLQAKESALQKLESSTAELNDFLLPQTNSLKVSLMEAEDKFILASSEAFTLREKVCTLEKELLNAQASAGGSQEQYNLLYSEISDMENVIEDLKDKLSKAESRAEGAEAKCKLLAETNMELTEELALLSGSGNNSKKVDSLERQLRESDIQLQHAVASAEASQEKQSMLYSAIGDMENLIEDLKSKVSKAEIRADSTEEKCIILSESNAELNEELNFLRGRMECLEASLHQAEETKVATARDIGIRTNVITNLVMQLAIERERLHKQISSLAKENKVLVVKLQQTSKDPSIVMSHDSKGNGKEFLFPEHELTNASCAKERKDEVTNFSTTSFELEKTQENLPIGEAEVGPADSISKLETVRRIDAGVLNSKHVVLAIIIVLISAAAYLYQQQNCPF